MFAKTCPLNIVLLISTVFHSRHTRASTIDDSISFKSLVLGSLYSGQNASGRHLDFNNLAELLQFDRFEKLAEYRETRVIIIT